MKFLSCTNTISYVSPHKSPHGLPVDIVVASALYDTALFHQGVDPFLDVPPRGAAIDSEGIPARGAADDALDDDVWPELGKEENDALHVFLHRRECDLAGFIHMRERRILYDI